MVDQFWVRWRPEYLQSLQRRPKWNKQERNLTAGDIVLVRDKEAHRNDWQLARVVEAMTSGDREVRKSKCVDLQRGSTEDVPTSYK